MDRKNIFQKIALVAMLLMIASAVSAAHVVDSVNQPAVGAYLNDKTLHSVEFNLTGPDTDAPYTAELEYSTVNTFGTANITTTSLQIGVNCFGTDFATGVVCSFNYWNTSAATDGTYYANVRVRDNASVPADNTTLGTFILDKTKPVVSGVTMDCIPTCGGVVPNVVGNDYFVPIDSNPLEKNILINITAADALSIPAVNEYSFDGINFSTGGNPATYINVDRSATKEVTFRSTDKAGNEEKIVIHIVDIISVSKPNGGEYVSSQKGNYDVEFVISDPTYITGTALTVNIDYKTTPGYTGATPIITALPLIMGNNCSGDFKTGATCSYPWTPTGVTTNDYYVNIQLIGCISCTEEDSSNNKFRIDSVSPTVSLTSIVEKGTFVTVPATTMGPNTFIQPINKDITISISTSDATTPAKNEYSIDGGSYVTGAYPSTPINVSATGNHTIGFRSTDLAGNESTRNFYIAELGDVVNPNGGESIASTHDIEFDVLDASYTGTQTYFADLYYSNTPKAFSNIIKSTLSLNATSCDSTNFNTGVTCTYSWPLAAVSDGVYYLDLRVYRQDSYGIFSQNTSGDSSFTVDNSGPALTSVTAEPVDNSPPTFNIKTVGTNYAVGTGVGDWQDEDYDVIIAVADSIKLATTSYKIDGGSAVVTTFNSLTGTTTIPVTTDGDHDIEFTATDAAGNTLTFHVYAALDKNPPVITNASPADNSYTKNTLQKITVSVFDGGLLVTPLLKMTVNGTVYYQSTELSYNSGTSVLTFTPSTAFVNGNTVTVSVYAQDDSGQSTTYSWDFKIDTSAPNALTDLDAQLTANNSVDLTWTASTEACVDHYNIYRSNSTITFTPGTTYAQAATNGYTDFSLLSSKDYFYRVTVVDCALNESNLSNEKLITTPVFASVFSLKPRSANLSLEQIDSDTATFTFTNISNVTQCLTELTVDNTTPLVSTSLNKSASVAIPLCLVAGATEDVIMTVNTNNAAVGSYSLLLRGLAPNNYETSAINLVVTKSSDIVMSQVNTNVCNLGTQNFEIDITNTSNTDQTLKLRVTNGNFNPFFDSSVVQVDAGETVTVPVLLSMGTNEFLSGSESMTVEALTNNGAVSTNTFTYNVQYCGSSSTAPFVLSVTNTCLIAEKDKKKDATISIRNSLNEKLTVNLQAISDLLVNIPSVVTVDAYDTELVSLSVTPSLANDAGEQDVKIYAWADNYDTFTAQENLCIDVLPKESSSLDLSDERIGIAKGKTETVQLRIQNIGDSLQSYKLSVINPAGFSVSLSDSFFSLNANEEEIVFMNVSADDDFTSGSYHIDVVLEDNENEFTERLVLLVSDTGELLKDVSFAAIPGKISASPGSSLTFDVVIVNNSSASKNVTIKSSGFPEGFSIEEQTISLQPFATARVPISAATKSNVASGDFEGQILLFSGSEQLDSKNVTFSTSGSGNLLGGLTQSITGLFTGENGEFGLLLLLIVIAAVGFFVLRKGQDVEQAQKEEVWARKR